MPTREQILDSIRRKVSHPASTRELMQILKVPREQRVAFRRILKSLAADGELVEVRGHRYGVADKMDLVVGRFQAFPNGAGVVVPERAREPRPPGILVSSTHLGEAMHGDRVVVRIERYRDEMRPEGRIIRILERANQRVVGRYDEGATGIGFVTPFDARLTADIMIPAGETRGAAPGVMVDVEIVRWPTDTRGPIGRVLEILGDIEAPGVDTRIIIRKYGLPDEHGPEAVAEARRMLGHLSSQHPRTAHAKALDVEGRTDFRDRTIVTIDGEHARDFDDAISLERLPNGHYWLGVHIADVSHYVQEGSALDAEAYDRGTSVYFPERALHMFPEALATGLCSLNPQVDRLVQSCLMEIDRRGHVVRHEFHDGVIRTRERMTYTAVNEILTGTNPETTARYEPLVPFFELMRELFQVLNDRRRRLGSIDFDLDEAEVVLDEAGQIEAIIAAQRNVAHRIIEEFMLLANETVAEFLDASGVPGLYRIHEEPDPLKVEQFEQFVAELGYSLAAPSHAIRPRHFQALVQRLHGKPEEKAVAALMLRTMQKARYDTENRGHFGLAFANYTHFTSPIRRYPDLVVHRLLRLARKGQLPAVEKEALDDRLPDVARHSSERERRADEAERELVQWKKVRFMSDKVGEDFDGYITGVTSFGLFVELIEHFVEGLVHVSTMADDYYRFLDASHSLRGESTDKVYRLGDRVRARVVRVDLEKRQIELGLVEILDARRAAKPSRRKSVGKGATASWDRPRAKEPTRKRSRVSSRPRRGRR